MQSMVHQALRQPKVEFFYDVLSPYAYLGFEVITRYQKVWDLDLQLKPFLLGAVMQGSGNKPPGLNPYKAKYMFEDLVKVADYYQVPLKVPADPANMLFKKGSLDAQRLLTVVRLSSPSFLEPLSRQFWLRTWSTDKDITSEESLMEACKAAMIPEDIAAGWIAKRKDPEIKKALADVTQEALDRGCFGAPCFFINGGGLIFGSDRFPVIAKELGKSWLGPMPTLPEMPKAKL